MLREERNELMVSFIVRFKFASEDRADVAETLRLLAAASRQEPIPPMPMIGTVTLWAI